MKLLRRAAAGLALCATAGLMAALAVPTLLLSAALAALWNVSDRILSAFAGADEAARQGITNMF